jgi:hypothetical protein
VQVNSSREAERIWRSSSVEGKASRQFGPRVGEGGTRAREAKDSLLLKAVARERLVKTEQAVVICELWRGSGGTLITSSSYPCGIRGQ